LGLNEKLIIPIIINVVLVFSTYSKKEKTPIVFFFFFNNYTEKNRKNKNIKNIILIMLTKTDISKLCGFAIVNIMPNLHLP
jgi:hypothetical protein